MGFAFVFLGRGIGWFRVGRGGEDCFGKNESDVLLAVVNSNAVLRLIYVYACFLFRYESLTKRSLKGSYSVYRGNAVSLAPEGSPTCARLPLKFDF